MANMSYCRFQNTVTDLRDCHEHIDDDDLSKEENRARTHLVTVCRQIAALFDDEADDSFDALHDDMERQSEIIAALRVEIATKDKRIQTLLEANRELSEKVRK